MPGEQEMLCMKCGKARTIRAHLIPRVFCTEVQVGTSHATGVRVNGSFHPSQSGTFDPHILCALCDEQLGKLEGYVDKICGAIRRQSINQSFGIKTCSGADKNIVLRFCAGILWKYSIAAKQFGRIDLFDHHGAAPISTGP
jgi:hypothetical protein